MSHSGPGAIPVRGSIQFGMVYDGSTNTFQVHIFRASTIAAVDIKKDISDPWVFCLSLSFLMSLFCLMSLLVREGKGRWIFGLKGKLNMN